LVALVAVVVGVAETGRVGGADAISAAGDGLYLAAVGVGDGGGLGG